MQLAEIMRSGIRHHAYALEDTSASGVLEQLVAHGITQTGSPDLFVYEKEQLSIDDARDIRERAARRPLADSYRVLVIGVAAMTHEAQNALLKTFEEPSGHTLFFIAMPSVHALLPTLRSRLEILGSGGIGNVEDTFDAPAFVRMSPTARLEALAPIIEERDKVAAERLLTSLEVHLAPRAANAREGIASVYRAKRYLHHRGASLKMLLEQVALLVP